MPKLTDSVPKYRKHKASGQAVVNLSGRDHYLGPWKSKASRIEYDRLIGEWIVNGRFGQVIGAAGMSDLTILELVAAYWRFAQRYYVKDGKTTRTLETVKPALQLLRTYYGHTLAKDFGPLAFAALRQRMIDADNCRGYINDHMGRVRYVFKWAASQELVSVAIHHALATVPGLRQGRSEARETAPVAPIDDAVVEATLAYLPPTVADMVRFQRLTGCRPAEVGMLRPCDVDRSGEVWAYRPQSHKTEHHGRHRLVFIGPRGQDILRPYLLRDSQTYCFVPAESEADRKAAMRADRKSRVQPSQVDRRKRQPRCKPGEQYTTMAYYRAILRACDKADAAAHEADASIDADTRIAPRWSPNRLRHSAATEIRREFGLEAAATVLGHARADVTQLYAERDMAKAASIMRQIG